MGTMQDPASFERRASDRHKSVLAVGKMVKDGRERFCLIRDISTGGLMIETSDLLVPGDAVMVETLGLPTSGARVIWSEGRLAGLAFDTPKDLETMCRRGVDDNGFTIRGPRFQSGRTACLSSRRSRSERDYSQHQCRWRSSGRRYICPTRGVRPARRRTAIESDPRLHSVGR